MRRPVPKFMQRGAIIVGGREEPLAVGTPDEIFAVMVERFAAALEALPGVGPWTAQYIAMRALAWPDAFPHPDVAVLKAMKQGRAKGALAAAESWRPWRAYAVLHLWKSLENLE